MSIIIAIVVLSRSRIDVELMRIALFHRPVCHNRMEVVGEEGKEIVHPIVRRPEFHRSVVSFAIFQMIPNRSVPIVNQNDHQFSPSFPQRPIQTNPIKSSAVPRVIHAAKKQTNQKVKKHNPSAFHSFSPSKSSGKPPPISSSLFDYIPDRERDRDRRRSPSDRNRMRTFLPGCWNIYLVVEGGKGRSSRSRADRLNLISRSRWSISLR